MAAHLIPYMLSFSAGDIRHNLNVSEWLNTWLICYLKLCIERACNPIRATIFFCPYCVCFKVREKKNVKLVFHKRKGHIIHNDFTYAVLSWYGTSKLFVVEIFIYNVNSPLTVYTSKVYRIHFHKGMFLYVYVRHEMYSSIVCVMYIISSLCSVRTHDGRRF